LYGVTQWQSPGIGANGAIFALSPGETERKLYRFGYAQIPAGLVWWNGELYGTTTTVSRAGGGSGAFFSLSPSGAFHQRLVSAGPFGTLVGAPVPFNGRLYFASSGGGGQGSSYTCGNLGCGLLYDVGQRGPASVALTFHVAAAYPSSAPVVLDGSLYGTTAAAIYRLTASGEASIEYVFQNSVDGEFPSGLTTYRGALYGYSLTSAGSLVFKFTPP